MIEPYFGIGHNLSLICQPTSEDIKHHFIIIITTKYFSVPESKAMSYDTKPLWHSGGLVGCCFTTKETVGLLGTGAHLGFHSSGAV